MTDSRAPLLHRYYPASSLLRAPPRPSRLPPISWVLQLYGFPAPPISRRDEEGFSSCLARPFHRAVASHPARVDRRFSQLRPSMLPSPYGCRLGLWAIHFRGHICVYFRYGPMAHCHPKDDMVDRLQRFSFLPLCYPSYGASDFCPGGIYSPLNTPAFAGHTTGRADFPHPAFRLASSLDSRTRVHLDISKPQGSTFPNTTSSLK